MASLKLLYSSKINGVIPVHKYKSQRTGLTVVLAEVEGPLVNGFFVLATEALDDDGLPHTLEHLIFLGSKTYPYKGFLDLLANRCLASGTNAWTDIDHTCYTMTTAGKDGFLELLPIYLDHILHPTLTDSAFITEVHHISEDGEDGGVVYCEMQGRENTGESLIHVALNRAAFPNSGYSVESGGIMKNLRTSTSVKKVRDYHAEFYRSENLTVIIAGQISIEEIEKSIEALEGRILEGSRKSDYQRPWQSPLQPLVDSTDTKILFPSDEEDCGIVNVGWRGPNTTTENIKLTAISILMRYLSDTSVSPLQRDFVEIPDPYAGQVSFNLSENAEALMFFSFESAPIGKIDLIFPKLQQILSNIAEGNECIDMNRMNNILERHILESLSNLENNPHEAVAFLVIGDVLYGHKPEDFEMRLNVNKQLKYLQTVDEAYWVGLIKEYFIDSKYIVIRAYPSIEEQQRMAKDEIERIEQQRNDLGTEGLAAKGEALMKAMAENDVEPPNEMLQAVPVPSTDGIRFHPTHIFRSGDERQPEGFSLDSLPVFAEAYDVHTNFVYMIVSLNTDTIQPEYRPYLLLLLELITESPIRQGDTLIPYEDVVAALEKDTISMGTHIGVESHSQFSCGPFSHSSILMLQVEMHKYNKGINWIVDLLHHTEFMADRIKVCASKMLNAVSQAKRKGNSIASALLKDIYYAKDTNVQVTSILRQYKFLEKLLERLDKGPAEAQSIIDDLNTLRSTITSTKNVALHIATDWSKISKLGVDLNELWHKVARSDDEPHRESLSVIPDWKLLKSIEELDSSPQGTVVGLGCVESAFLFHSSPAINDFMDPDLPALMLFLQYLSQLEGPMWRQIRGPGFAYGYNFVPRPHEGILCFTLYRSTNLVAAFKAAKTIMEAQLNPNAEWEPTLLQSAKSSLIFEIIQREKSIGDLVIQSLLSSFKKVPIEYNRLLVKGVNAATTEDLSRVGKKYVSQLFSTKAKTAIVCHPDKSSDIAAAFSLEFGRELTVVTSLEDSILGKN